ncbi:glycosyltransferase [Pyrococcus sp. NA2]|uniref:glycosyltransferase family 4 protein n=1 Tax=Pyrococcus sp. (strain NA2) TaxID=342949 RepID=UPI000209A9FE|nr:glycosyltransferase family 4 protein [Pyrococcus sp. NA2]AEC51939.1 glycosyltransferase [Pyrococcus sp. NA2]
MKVVLVMPYSDPPSWGVQNVAYNLVQGFIKLCKELERKGIEITILSNAGITLKPQEEFSQCSQLRIVSYKQLPPITFLGDIQHILLARRYFHIMLSSADTIHSHDVTFSLPIARMFKDKLIIHNFHGLPWNEKRYLNSRYQRFSYNIMTIRNKKLAEFKNVRFIAISHFVAEDVQRTLGVPDEQIHIVYDPVSEDFFNIEKIDMSGIIFYPARLIPRKNHLSLIKALGILKKDGLSHFTLALTGVVEDKEYFNKIMQLVRKYDLNNNVMFLGKISKEKLFEYYSKASIVVLTSLEESFSLAVAEAMATGTPVVASPVGVVPEAITHGKNGFVINPRDPHDIAEKLRIVLEDDKKRRCMGKRAKKTADKWRSENIARDLMKLWGGFQ